MKLLHFLKPADHIKRIPAEQVDAAYKKYSYQNFAGIFIAYAGYYLMRNNFSLAMPYLVQNGYSKAQLGMILSALLVAYGISKFLMGNLSDRSNPRYFLAIGLLISIIINVIFGCFSGVITSMFVMYTLMFINGWAQGMGGPPCYRTLAHWFSVKTRGRVMSMWNVSHSLGAALLGGIAIIVIPFFTWRGIFYVPAVLVTALTIIVVMTMRDTPQSVGLMPIEEYKNEHSHHHIDETEREKELSGKEIIFKYVLVNKYIWFLAMAQAAVYFIRYGISSWAPTYLTEIGGVKASHSGSAIVVYEIAGILGMLLCGYASDKFFKGRRAPVSILCMIIVLLGIIFYWFSTNVFASHIALFIIGMFIYGPLMLVGVQVLDIIPKKAVGTAVGLVGLFAYWIGSIPASAGFGYIVDLCGWGGGFVALTISCFIAIFFFSLTLRIK